MLNIIVIASVLAVVCGAQHAYFGNNLVEFDDAPTQTISLPYPYQEPNVVRVAQTPVNYGVGVRTAVVTSPTLLQSQSISLSPFQIICSMVSSSIGFVRRIIMYFITSVPSIIFGCVSLFRVCNLTSICNYFNIDPLRYVNEITSIVSPERLKRATEFVETAIKKYSALQEN